MREKGKQPTEKGAAQRKEQTEVQKRRSSFFREHEVDTVWISWGPSRRKKHKE